MTISMTPGQRRRLRTIAWYLGTTLLAVVVTVLAIRTAEDNPSCGVAGLQVTRTTVPNPLDLLTKPIPTPGALSSNPSDGTCP